MLLALATPVLGLRLGMPDDGNDAKGTTTRVAYDRLAEGFGVGFNGPLVLATDNMGDAATRRGRRAQKTPGVAFVSEPVSRARQGRRDADRDPDDVAAGPEDERPRRPTSRPTCQTGVYVGGAVAMLDDMAAKIADPAADLHRARDRAEHRAADGGVPLASGSRWSSAAFNLLSIGAAYGVVVAVFQTGMGDVPIVSSSRCSCSRSCSG